MDPFAAFRSLPAARARDAFARHFALGFFLRKPVASPPGARKSGGFEDSDDDDIGFTTALQRREDIPLDLIDDDDAPDPHGWIVAPLVKRPGNPFPERLSVGRAQNCDIVLRYPTVSKLHAHVHVAQGRVVGVTDYRSSNGTAVGSVVASASPPVPLRAGESVRFGSVTVDLVTAGVVHALMVGWSEG